MRALADYIIIDLGTLGGDESWANAINNKGLKAFLLVYRYGEYYEY